MNAISTFTFHSNYNIRIIDLNGELWFVATDVASALDYRNAPDMTRSLDDDETDTHNLRIRSESGIEQDRQVTIINESGLYSAILKSRKPQAKKFKKWVTSEVLPSIRKTGQYQVPTQAKAPNYITNDDMNNIKRLVWFCASFFDHEDAFSRAAWSSLRHVTNKPSPEQFEVEQLPLLESEFKRLYSIIEPYLNTRRTCEKALIKYFVRGHADAALLQQLLDQMHGSVENLHENTNVKFPQLFKVQCTDLTRRKA